jgi:hypothetical protein
MGKANLFRLSDPKRTLLVRHAIHFMMYMWANEWPMVR